MQVGRPPGGFHVKLSAAAEATLDGVRGSVPRIHRVWDGICERLKFTAHREGQPLPNGDLVIQFPGDPPYGIPTIAVCYSVRADGVFVKRLLIRIDEL